MPKKGAALLVFYHGLVPLDFWYFGLKWYTMTGKPASALVDRFLMKTPGLAWFTRNLGGVVGERRVAEKLLRSGTIVGVSPGGVREAISGTKNNYRLVWGGRKGFAELALAANVPIIPGFTRNVEELYRAPGAGSPLANRLYEFTRLPLVPILGIGPLPFPVQLSTFLGPPIQAKLGETAEDLAKRTQTAIEELIAAHQRPQNTVLQALLDRIR